MVRRDREISLVGGADEAHPSVLLRSRPATLPQAQELRGRLVHVHDAGWVHVVLRHVVHQNRSLSTCVSNSLGSVVFSIPPDATRYLKPALWRKLRIHLLLNLRVMSCCSATLLKMGCITDAEIGTPASPTRSPFSRRVGTSTSQASRGSRPFLLVVIQPSSQCPRREPRLEDIRQPCRQVVHDHPVVPSKQVAQHCLERGHPVAQGLCVLLVRGWLPDASLLQGWPPIRLQLDCRIVPPKHLVAAATFKREH